ncbi:MFS transporter [Microvirga sp. BT689]|uniref:MFS transporter n=1 Tax=Microvirga arvi TaxID=2778731 RepID=UPI00194FCF1A|nr:MFS transporter [Microvirga arvi]MBM6581887.1 MFS transporter [Microvirga arvi]
MRGPTAFAAQRERRKVRTGAEPARPADDRRGETRDVDGVVPSTAGEPLTAPTDPSSRRGATAAAVSESSRGGRPGALSPFRYRIFCALWTAMLLSNLGWMIQSVGISWMMASIGASADVVALVQASITLPIMLFALVAGAVADNFDRRRLMLVSQIFNCAAASGLAVCIYLGFVTPWLLLAFTFLISSGAAISGPAWQSLVGEIVPRREIPSAIAINAVGFNIARTVGPAIGGMILAAAGPFAGFVTNALSYIPLIVVLSLWRPPERRHPLPPENLRSAIIAGICFVSQSPGILAVLLRGAAFGVAASSFQSLLPLIARDSVGGGPLTFGLLLGSFGIGAICGAFVITRLRRSLSLEGTVRLAFLGFAYATAIAGLSSAVALTASGALVGGASFVLVLSSLNATVQLSTPRWVVGRALAVYQMATFGGMALGSWIWGNVAEHLSVTSALMASAACLVLGAALGIRFGLPDSLSLDLDPADRREEPDISLSIRPHSGPIIVTVEYLIREADEADFLAAMSEVRRIRRRDGARRWTLLRDLSDAKIWIERYQSPTWLDHIRQNHRLTRADVVASERVLALHEGPDAPRIRRTIEQTRLSQ